MLSPLRLQPADNVCPLCSSPALLRCWDFSRDSSCCRERPAPSKMGQLHDRFAFLASHLAGRPALPSSSSVWRAFWVMERAAVYLTAPRPLTAGTPRRAPQGGLPAQNRCCRHGAFLSSALTSEACRARLSSLACQAGTHICFPCFLAIRAHMAPALQGGPGSSCRPGQAGGAPQRGDGADGGALWATPPGCLAPCPRWSLGRNWALGLSQAPAAFSRGSLCFLLDSWEPSACTKD